MDESLELAELPDHPAEYSPRLLVTPEQARSLVDGVAEIARSIMVEGTDYGVIPGTPKPSLWKPGAEKLLGYFGFGHHFADNPEIERDANGEFIGVTYRCIVTKAMGGESVVVASCDGYAGRDENGKKNNPRNTVVKMAQKRALVGACLQATATSGLFTQDVEDYDATDRPTRSGGGGGRGPTEKQLNFFGRLIEEKLGGDADRVRKFVQEVTGRTVANRGELTGREVSELIDRLLNGPIPGDDTTANVCDFCLSDPCECSMFDSTAGLDVY